jgi:protein-S-isoprenylcysteine O-methyltransferase Ste14
MVESDLPISDNQQTIHDNDEKTVKEIQPSVNVQFSRTIFILNVTLIVLSVILCVLLIIQFFLGMGVNVYVTLQPLKFHRTMTHGVLVFLRHFIKTFLS